MYFHAHMWAVLLFAILFGFALLFAELFIVPGITIVGIAGLLFLGIGVWQVYEIYGTLAGNVALLSVVAIGAWTIWRAFKTQFWKSFELHEQLEGKALPDAAELGLQTEMPGKALSALRPMGKAKFGKIEVEVESLDGWLEVGVNIKIVALEGQKVYVKTN